MSRPDPAPKGSTEPATAQRPTRTRLAHFAIFNPSIPPPSRSARPTSETEPPDTLQHVDASHDYPARGTDGDTGDDQSGEHLEVDKDDLEQAAQIVFYTCPSDKNVERDVMLRQVGLVRGLMAFTSYVQLAAPFANTTAEARADQTGLLRRETKPGGLFIPITPGWSFT